MSRVAPCALRAFRAGQPVRVQTPAAHQDLARVENWGEEFSFLDATAPKEMDFKTIVLDGSVRYECNLCFFFCDFENLFIRVGKSPENLICRHPFFPLTFSILKFIVLIYRVEPVVWLSPCQIAVHLNTCGGFNIGWWENRPTLQHRAPSILSAVVVVIHALWPALVPSQGVHRALIHPVHRCLAEEALALPVALVIRVVLALNAPQCQLATLALVAK